MPLSSDVRSPSFLHRLAPVLLVASLAAALGCTGADVPRSRAEEHGIGAAAAALTAPRWDAAPPMNIARSRHTATRLLDGRVLVAGGASATAEVYDPGTTTWTLVAPM